MIIHVNINRAHVDWDELPLQMITMEEFLRHELAKMNYKGDLSEMTFVVILQDQPVPVYFTWSASNIMQRTVLLRTFLQQMMNPAEDSKKREEAYKYN